MKEEVEGKEGSGLYMLSVYKSNECYVKTLLIHRDLGLSNKKRRREKRRREKQKNRRIYIVV